MGHSLTKLELADSNLKFKNLNSLTFNGFLRCCGVKQSPTWRLVAFLRPDKRKDQRFCSPYPNLSWQIHI